MSRKPRRIRGRSRQRRVSRSAAKRLHGAWRRRIVKLWRSHAGRRQFHLTPSGNADGGRRLERRVVVYLTQRYYYVNVRLLLIKIF